MRFNNIGGSNGIQNVAKHHQGHGHCTHLFVFLQFLMVYLSDLTQLGAIIRMFDRVISSTGSSRGVSSRPSASSFLGPRHALSNQHVIQTHELRVRRLLLLGVSERQNCNERGIGLLRWCTGWMGCLRMRKGYNGRIGLFKDVYGCRKEGRKEGRKKGRRDGKERVKRESDRVLVR